MPKKIINVTDITSYLFCPMKLYLKMVKGLREPPNVKMILGMLKHKVFDVLNKNDSLIVSSLLELKNKKEIEELYYEHLIRITKEVESGYSGLIKSWEIDVKELEKSISNFMQREIELRASSISSFMSQGFLGKELWRNLKPKYLTEFELVSEELGLKGRIDRIKISQDIIPYELKTREDIFESDKIQLVAYALLLEKEFNKPIGRGIVETAKGEHEIEINQELKNKVLKLADEIRNLEKNKPSLQNNFSKCENCQFNNICFE